MEINLGIKDYALMGLSVLVVVAYFYGHSKGVDKCEDDHKNNQLTLTSQSAGKLVETEKKYDAFEQALKAAPTYGKADPKCGVPDIIKFAIDKLPNPSR